MITVNTPVDERRNPFQRMVQQSGLRPAMRPLIGGQMLDVTRANNHHLSFGHGVHFCVGSQFARLEARLAFSALLERTRDISLDSVAPDDLWHHDNFNIRCFRQLPLRFAFA